MKKKVVENTLVAYIHCSTCINDRPSDTSPKDWSRTQFGWTPKGFQIWCNRCEINVGAYDLCGNKIKYDFTLIPDNEKGLISPKKQKPNVHGETDQCKSADTMILVYFEDFGNIADFRSRQKPNNGTLLVKLYQRIS